MFGDRKMVFYNDSYIIDEKNRLFIEIKWGKNKKSKSEFRNC